MRWWAVITYAAVVGTVRSATEACATDDYYSGITYLLPGQQPSNQEEWEILITELYTLLQATHVVIPYTSTSTDVWDALGVLDADPSDPAKVMLTYSGVSMDWSRNGDTTGWNREHVWPRSYGLFDNGADYSDLHNLRPADMNVNSARNNLYYDDCYPGEDPTCTQPAHIEAASDTAKNSFKFMPSASEKGDLARAAFYVALRYNGTIGVLPEPNTEQLTLSACPCVANQFFGNLTTLLQWHALDAVTEAELNRNNQTCFLYQKNRNPFVDFPWLSQMFSVPYALERVHQACPSDYIDPDSTSCEATATESLSPTTAPSSMSPPTVEPVACNLLAGDVAIVSFNSDTPDTLTVVALRSIPANSKLFFTDRPWNGNEFPTSSEGVLQFVTSDIVSAGSQWFYPDGGGVLGTWSIASGTFNLAADGDQIIVYCGAITSPTFLYALTNNGWISGGGSVSSTTSYFPDSLSGTNASVSLPSVDNQHYVGTTAGTESSLLETISISSNWTGSNTAASPTFISEFMVYELTFSPTASPSMISSSQRPTMSPTTMPGTETKMQFTISIVLDNVDSAAVDDDASDKAIRLTLQDALIELSLSDISILSMTEFSSGFSAVELVVYSFTVNYLVEVVLEQLGYTASDGAELYSNWVAAVDVSVSSGDFSTNLSNNAEATNAVPLYDATANSAQEVEYGEYSLTSISTSQKGSTHSVTLGTRIGYISFIACMVIASVYIVWSFIDGRKKFMLKFPPKATRISGKHDASVDDFSVTVNRTTFSKRISTSSETLAHVSNPMRKVPEESSSDNSL